MRRAALLFAILTRLHAAGHRNLDGGLALTAEDAYPVARGEISLQGGWDRERRLSELEYGIARDWQLNLSDRPGLLYNFNTETRRVPAFAVKAEGDLLAGDASWKAIVTRSFGFNRLHLNGGAGRLHRWETALGCDRPVGLQTLLVAGLAAREGERTAAELGLRRQLAPREVLSLGVVLDRHRFYFRCALSRTY